jgi:hypothetical protein
MKTIKLTLLGIMVMLVASLRAQTTTYDSPGNTINIVSDVTYPGDVIIKPLTTVVIQQGVTVKMNLNKKIQIEKGGAKLVVNGSVTYNGTPTGNETWEGIHVIGDKTLNQPSMTSVLNNVYPGSNSNTQGILILDGATITYARNAVLSYEGGIVYCNSTFMDYCQLAFAFHYYPKQICARIQNSTLIRRNSSNSGFITCVDGYGLVINNTTIQMQGVGTANSIFLLNYGISVSNCSISGFETGITNLNYIGGIRRHSSITGNTFTDNNISLHFKGPDFCRIRENSFISNTNQNTARATWLDGITGYEYYGNIHTNFKPTNTNTPPAALIVSNSGIIGNRINNNTFNNNYMSVSCQFNNRGLQLQCNNFNTTTPSANTRNIDVYGESTFPISIMGIPNQGAIINNDAIGYYLPGNLFSNDCGHGTPADIQANNHVQSFIYFHHSPVNQNRIRPDCNSSTKVNTIQASINTTTLPQACALQYNNPGLVMDQIGIKDQLIQTQLVEMPENYQQNITYLKQSIEADVYALMHIYAEMEDDSMLVAFLTHDITPQKRMAYIQYLIGENQFDDALVQLGNLAPDSLNPDIEVFKTYFTRLTELLENNADLAQLSSEDIDLFTSIAATASPTAAKAQNLIALSDQNDLVSALAKNKDINTSFSLYPNPAKDAMYISGTASFSKYVIFDITMKQIASGDIVNNAIGLKNIQAGVYFVKLSDGETSVIRKFVIND